MRTVLLLSGDSEQLVREAKKADSKLAQKFRQRAYWKSWRAKNIEKIRLQKKAWRERNREHVREYERRHYQESEALRLYRAKLNRKYRARRKAPLCS